MRRLALSAVVAGLAALGGGWLALGAAGQGKPAARADAYPGHSSAPAELPPLPKSRARVVQPVAGETSAGAGASTPAAADPGLSDPAPSEAASAGLRGPHPAVGGQGALHRATALGNGVALPPLEAPDGVRQIIDAGNAIARSPYIWGGGHGRWRDKGYDCSGSVSFALAAAGLLDGPLDSGRLMHWGEPGKGKWVTIYANAGHVFLEIAGIRFDTGAQRVTGSRWANDGRSTAGFVPRHPAGL